MNKLGKYLSLILLPILFITQFADVAGFDAVDSTKFCKEGINDGKTLYVGGSGPGNYTSIQSAIDNASDGDTIFVFNGTYHENIIIDKSVNLIGEDRNITIIDGGRKGNVINVTASHVVISNFTVDNSGSYYLSAGIKICSSNCKILDCNIFRSLDYGIWIVSSDNVISKCNISYTTWESGIFIENSTNNRIVNCTLSLNEKGGITLLHSHENVISDCTFKSNRAYGLWLVSSENETISNCVFIDDGLFMQGDELSHFLHEIRNNTVDGFPLLYYRNMENALIDDIQAGEIILADCKNFTIRNVDIFNKKAGIEIAFSEENEIHDCDIEEVNKSLTLFYSHGNEIYNCNIKNCSDGIVLFYSSKNEIHGCNISNSGGGIMLWQSSYNKIYYCNIMETTNSMSLFGYLTFGNFIFHNNFIRNKWNPVFVNSVHNMWLRNYWDGWHLPFPKPIFGVNFIFYIIQIPWIQFDWMPRPIP